MTPQVLRSHLPWIAALALSVLAFSAQPNMALAHDSHYSGGDARGGGGHSGVGHVSVGRSGGASMGAPRGGRYSAAGAYRGGGYSGAGHASVGRYGGPSMGAPRGARFGTARVAPRQYGGRSYDRGDSRRYGRDYRGGYGRGYGNRWGGGNWHGRYWPPVLLGASFLWFLPVIPAYSPIYWWGQVPYYYYNDAYYTWDSVNDGYVATAPPPVTSDDEGGADNAGDAQAPSGEMAPEETAPEDAAPGGHLYAYPKNGQSLQQQARDRQACDAWARSPAGADTDATTGIGNGDDPGSSTMDYRRALSACLTGRGYSVD